MLRTTLLSVVLLLSANAQDEASLRRYFEGKQVRVKLDMPGTQQGIDIHWNQDPPIDFKAYSQRMKSFPRAISEGDIVRVTTVRVKSKNIEFQLNGGGYGTLGDDTGSVTAQSVPKTSREQQLEKDVKKETDTRRRDQLNRELGRLQSERQREESYQRSRAAEMNVAKQAQIEDRRRTGGSRFNIWFPNGYLQESIPTPEQLMRVLSAYIEFTPTSERAPQPASIRRGMTRDEVESQLGRPSRTSQRTEGSLKIDTATWESSDQVTTVDFLDGLVIKFSTTSK
jgi:hypothetical protein